MRALTRWLAAMSLLCAMPAAAAGFPSGYWYGEARPRKVDTMWFADLSPNGKFMVHFRTCYPSGPRDDLESGTWTYGKDTLTLHIASLNGAARNDEQQYVTLSSDKTAWRYRYLATGFVFNAIRVDAGFELPESCGTIS